MNSKPSETHEPLHDRTPGLQRELLQLRGDVNAALEPVEDWYDVHGNEGPKRTIREILDDVVGDLVDDRKQNLALQSLCRLIVDEAKFSSDGRTGRVADDLIDKLESLLG